MTSRLSFFLDHIDILVERTNKSHWTWRDTVKLLNEENGKDAWARAY